MNKTGGILLAGGKGTRLYPNTLITNKHLMPIYDKPMIYYSLSILLLAQIKDITIVCNPNDQAVFKKLFNNGEQFGINITYSIQDNPSGIPDAINTAQKISNYEKFMVVLGDNFLYGRDIFQTIKENFTKANNASIFYQTVRNPDQYGVIRWEGKSVYDVVEKPKEFVSNDAIIGLYIFDKSFSHYFNQIKKSEREEFEIVDIIKLYGLDDISANFIGRGTAWFDMGSSEDFFNSSQFVKTIQDRQGLLVCSPHEIALRNGWISVDQLQDFLNNIKGSEYASNLLTSLGIS
jgi:glucose-1-phosphate thymidylyltransferase